MPDSNLTFDRLALSLTETGARAVIRVIFQFSTDSELIALWHTRNDTPGNPLVDLLAIEMERRAIEF